MYNSFRAYGQSQLANILHANEIARRLKEERVNITANSLHPGEITTNLFRHNGWLDSLVKYCGRFVIKNVQQGAATTCYVALHPQIKGVSGEYFLDNNKCKRTAKAENKELVLKLWDFGMSLTEPEPK
ncbi:Short-chain dehydrogenase TIC 32, chloroplastic-like protein [Drosera capensis]